MAFSSTGPPFPPLTGVAAVSAFVTSSCSSSIDLSAGPRASLSASPLSSADRPPPPQQKTKEKHPPVSACGCRRTLFFLTREKETNTERRCS